MQIQVATCNNTPIKGNNLKSKSDINDSCSERCSENSEKFLEKCPYKS